MKVWSVVTSSASAENQLVTVGLVGGRSADASVAIQPEIRTYADGGSTVVSTGAGVSFLAAHNYNPDGATPGYLGGNKAEVSAGSYGGALVDIDVGSNIDATAKADVDTSIKANATVRAGNRSRCRLAVEQQREGELQEHQRCAADDQGRRRHHRRVLGQHDARASSGTSSAPTAPPPVQPRSTCSRTASTSPTRGSSRSRAASRPSTSATARPPVAPRPSRRLLAAGARGSARPSTSPRRR